MDRPPEHRDGRPTASKSPSTRAPAAFCRFIWFRWMAANPGITNDPAGGEVPSWSRDGKAIYYTTIHDGSASVWKQPIAGGAAQPVSSNGGIYAAESVDRKFVYFSRSSNDSTLWRVPESGGSAELLAVAPPPYYSLFPSIAEI